MGKNSDKMLFYSKILFVVGVTASIICPQYAYYWKRTTMDVNVFKN